MKRNNKKVLYESIMTSVAREVKKVLNDDSINEGLLDNIGAGINAYKDSKNKEQLTNEMTKNIAKVIGSLNDSCIALSRLYWFCKDNNLPAGQRWIEVRKNLIKFLEDNELLDSVAHYKETYAKYNS